LLGQLQENNQRLTTRSNRWLQNAEWRHLHAEKGSLVAYLNHDKQLQEDKFSDKSDGSELSEEETEKMQKAR
jgi:hypothetical protein